MAIKLININKLVELLTIIKFISDQDTNEIMSAQRNNHNGHVELGVIAAE